MTTARKNLINSASIPYYHRMVCCKDNDRPGVHENTSFDFLSYTFRPRMARSRNGKYLVSFLPAISKASAQAIRDTIRELKIPAKRSLYSLEELAKLINPMVLWWSNYYGKFYPSELKKALNYVEAPKYAEWPRNFRFSIAWYGKTFPNHSSRMCTRSTHSYVR